MDGSRWQKCQNEQAADGEQKKKTADKVDITISQSGGCDCDCVLYQKYLCPSGRNADGIGAARDTAIWDGANQCRCTVAR
jgi:hypothetical protein